MQQLELLRTMDISLHLTSNAGVSGLICGTVINFLLSYITHIRSVCKSYDYICWLADQLRLLQDRYIQLLRFLLFFRLTEMHLSLNEHEDISLPNPLQTYPTVKKIHMSKNKIKHWSQLHKVGRLFPNLENFVNIESDLENLRSPIEEENDMAQIFSKMKTLVLTQTKLGRWEDLERLRHCPALVDLKVLGIPFLEVVNYEI